MTKLPPSDTGACGQYRGARRHTRKGEETCPACKEARRDYQRKRLGIEGITGAINANDLIEEIEFFLSAGRGQYEILKAIGNPKPDTLKQRLARHGRSDLATRIYNMDEEGVWAA
jgi:hypothetical protein